MAFGQQLREAMGEMTQEQLAALSGVRQTTISKHIRGDARPSIDFVDVYERVLPRLREIRDRDRDAAMNAREVSVGGS